MGYLHIFILHLPHTHTHTHACFNHIVWFYKMHYKCLALWTFILCTEGKQSFYGYLQQKHKKCSFCFVMKNNWSLPTHCTQHISSSCYLYQSKNSFFPSANLEGFSDLQNCTEYSLSIILSVWVCTLKFDTHSNIINNATIEHYSGVAVYHICCRCPQHSDCSKLWLPTY